MNVYLVNYRVKNGGYRDGDQATSGGNYDLHKHVVITASSGLHARNVVMELVKELHPAHECTVQQPKRLGAA